MSVAFQIATIILTAITMATALAHALELPGKMRLTREQYLAVQRIYYPGFTLAGAAEPLAIVALTVQLALTPSGLPIFWITAGALAASVLTHLLYWLLTAPVNKVWVKDEKLSGAAQTFFGAGKDALASEDWVKLRDRWEYSHLYRAISAVTAFVLATVAGVI